MNRDRVSYGFFPAVVVVSIPVGDPMYPRINGIMHGLDENSKTVPADQLQSGAVRGNVKHTVFLLRKGKEGDSTTRRDFHRPRRNRRHASQ
jgi:hypothetical protein